MNKIEGLVLHAVLEGIDFPIDTLYGQSMNYKGQTYESIETNGYSEGRATPRFYFYSSREEMKKSMKEIGSRKPVINVYPAFVLMNIAEREEELDELENSKSLIIIAKNPDIKANTLVGKYVNPRPAWGVMPGAYMRFNGMNAFNNLRSAKIMCRESSRQGGCISFISTWQFDYLR